MTLVDDASTARFYSDVFPHAEALLRAATLLCRDAHEAEDLAQETLLKAVKSLRQLKPGDNAWPWLMTILRNTRIDRLRSSKARLSTASLETLEIDPADESTPARDDSADWPDPAAMLAAFADQAIIDALHALPEDIRWTLLLIDVQGLDLKDAAAVMNVPVGTVKSRSSRGRAMLRERLKGTKRGDA